MLQRLFNRDGKKHPKGPSFKRAVTREKNISGNQLTFLAPAPSGNFAVTHDKVGQYIDIFSSEGYQSLRDDEYGVTTETELKNVFGSSWQFNGIPLIDVRPDTGASRHAKTGHPLSL